MTFLLRYSEVTRAQRRHVPISSSYSLTGVLGPDGLALFLGFVCVFRFFFVTRVCLFCDFYFYIHQEVVRSQSWLVGCLVCSSVTFFCHFSN